MGETPRASDLQIQVEQVNLALRQLKQTQESLTGLETRLADMTRECATILDRWASNDERHATAVVELHSRLGEWNDIERRLLSESATRIHQFERGLQHEWTAIRQSHEEPLRQIEAQTTRVTEACLTAVESALKGFDRAESRIAALEEQLQQQMGTLAREVREAVAELRQGPPQLTARQPWSLDNVVRLHNELRTEGGPIAAAHGTLALAESVAAPAEAQPAPLRDVPAFASAESEPAPNAISRRVWIGSAVLLALFALFALYMQGQLQAGLREAAARAESAERSAIEARDRAAREIEAARQAAEARLTAAQQAARQAQTLALIASSPDAARFDLAAREGSAAAQVIFSRARGTAVTAAGLPAPPEGRTYYLWLLAPSGPVAVGPLALVEGGGTVVFEARPELPRPIVRAFVTLEPDGGSPTPTGPATLAVRAQAPPR